MLENNELFTITQIDDSTFYVHPNYELTTIQDVLYKVTTDVDLYEYKTLVPNINGNIVICNKGKSSFFNDPSSKTVPFILMDTEVLVDDVLVRLGLRRIRRSAKMTQKDLSDLSGLSTQTISNIESDDPKQTPTMKSIIKYTSALGYEVQFKKK